MKFLKIIYYIIGVIPWFFTVSLSAFYFHAAIILGYLPAYDDPDPKEISVYKFYAPIIDPSMTALLFGFFGWLILSMVVLLNKQRKQFVNRLVLSALGYVIAIVLFFSGIMAWFID